MLEQWIYTFTETGTTTGAKMGHPTASQTNDALVKGIEKILERLERLEKKLDEYKDKNEN